MANELLSLSKIHEECELSLSFSEEKKLGPLFNEDEILLFAHKPISIPFQEKKDILCPIFLYDATNKKYSYLFFLTGYIVEDSSLFIWNEKAPIFCHATIRLLKQSGVLLSAVSDNDLNGFLVSLERGIEEASLSSRFSLIHSLQFVDKNILVSNDIENITYDIRQNTNVPSSLEGLLKDIQSEKKDMEIDKIIPSGPFSNYRKAWTGLDYYPAIRAFYPDLSICSDFLLETLSLQIQLGRKITLLVHDDEEEKDIVSYLNSHHLKGCYQDSQMDDPVPSDIEEQKKRLEEARSNYLRLAKKKKELFLYPGLEKELSDVLYDTILKKEIGYDAFDLSSYSDEGFKNDQVFLKRLSNLSLNLLEHPIIEHPFYGLSSQSKNSSYDHLILTIIEVKKNLYEFKEALSKEGFMMLDESEIQCFSDFEETGKDIDVLHDYNGFPRRLFKISDPEDSSLKIKTLKQSYQSVSSTKLLVTNLCDEKILNEDLAELLYDYKKGIFIKRRMAKKKILSYLKVEKNALDTVIRVLDSYLLAKKTLEEILPSYIEAYGDSVSTMNGASEIEANIQYLRKFRMRSNYHPIFRLDNPIVKRGLRDHEYREALYQKYQRLNVIYQKLKRNYNSYIGYFLDGPRNDFSTGFDILAKRLDRQLYASRSDFLEYAALKERYLDTSYLLKQQVEKAVNERRSFKMFKEHFLYSLYHTIYDEAEKESQKIDASLSQSLLSYQKEIENENDLFDYLLKDKILSKKREQKEEVLTLRRIEDVQESDLSIVLDAKRYKDMDLIYLLSQSKNVIFLEHKDDTDKRIFGYPSYRFNHHDLYGFVFDVSSLSKAFYDGIIKVSLNLGYEVVRNDPRFPLCLRKQGDKDVSFFLVPDSLMQEKYWTETESMLREFFYTSYHVLMISFISFEGGFEKEQILKKITQDHIDA